MNTIRIVLPMLITISFYFPLAFADDFRYDSHGKRDPFMSQAFAGALGAKQIGVSQLRLEGIVFEGSGNAFAVINGEIIKEGDHFAGFKVLKIEANQVTFQSSEGETVKIVLDREEAAIQQYLTQAEQKGKISESKPVQFETPPKDAETIKQENEAQLQILAESTRKTLMETPKSEPEFKYPVAETIPPQDETKDTGGSQ